LYLVLDDQQNILAKERNNARKRAQRAAKTAKEKLIRQEKLNEKDRLEEELKKL